MSKRACILLLWLSLTTLRLSATTPVTGSIKDLSTGAVQKNARVRLWLRGCNGNTPRVSGTALIAPSQGTSYFKDFTPDGTGAISGTVYSTRDAAGTGNGDIDCGGSKLSVWYGVQVFVNGVPGPELAVHAKNGVTLDLTNVTPITVNPVIPSPTGDTTYARLDGGNQPFTGPITLNLLATLLGGGKLAEIVAPACVAGFDLLWGDSTAHRLKECDNGGAAIQLVHSGADINTSDQVTVTHLAAPLPVAQGGTGVTVAQGTGPKNQLAAGTTITGDFLSYDASGNAVDSGKVAPTGAVVGTTDTQALTGKTFDTAGAGNIFKINGIQITAPPMMIMYGCRGTASPATSLILSTSTCNDGTGFQTPVSAGTIKNLRCKAQTGGVNASSGAFTVRKNGVGQATTCTIGTGTTCSDITHTFSVADGDLIDLIFTTQTAETLAQIVCTMERQ